MLKLKDLNTVLEPCEKRLVYIYKRHVYDKNTAGPPQFFCQILTSFYNDVDVCCLADIISKSEHCKTPNEILESRILFMYEETFMHEPAAISDEISGLAIVVYVDAKEVYE